MMKIKKGVKLGLVIGLSLLSFLLANHTNSQEGESRFLPNPSFEKDLTYWEAECPSPAKIDIDEKVVRQGRKSAKISATELCPLVSLSTAPIESRIGVIPGETYTFSGYIRTNLTQGSAHLKVDFYGGKWADNRTGSYFSDLKLEGINGWTLVSVAESAPPNSSWVSFQFEVESFIGTIWLDDVKVIGKVPTFESAPPPESINKTILSTKRFEESLYKNKTKFAFALVGDHQVAIWRDNQIFERIVEEINKMSPDFVIETGDLICGVGEPIIDEKQYKGYLWLISQLKMPLYPVRGNHDESPEIYEKMLQTKRYYSFNYGNSHFIVLDAYFESGGGIVEPQLSWLKKDLEQHKDFTHIFVALHPPVWSIMNPGFETGHRKHVAFTEKENRDKIVELLTKYKVKMTFSGHEHFFSKGSFHGITQIIAGSSGVGYYADEEHGGFPHFVLVKVDGKKLEITLYKLNEDGSFLKLDPDSISTPTSFLY